MKIRPGQDLRRLTMGLASDLIARAGLDKTEEEHEMCAEWLAGYALSNDYVSSFAFKRFCKRETKWLVEVIFGVAPAQA